VGKDLAMIDTEQQVRLNFLEEAEEYFEQLETILLNLATADDRPQQLDAALRAAHSIKGSAGMMGFMPLSHVAHRLEDSFKILRARLIEIDTELETLLLAGVDGLREVKQYHYEGQTVDDAWLQSRMGPIFDQLHARLGDVTDDDENTLLAADEDIDITIVMFTSGVEGALSEFEALRPSLGGEDLRSSLLQYANKMLEFGLIGNIDPFISLCGSIQAATAGATVNQLANIADEALELWQRTSALVALGRMEQLPSQLEWSTNPIAAIDETAPISAAPSSETTSGLAAPEITVPDIDLASLQASLNTIDLSNVAALIPNHSDSSEITASEITAGELANSELANSEIEPVAPESTNSTIDPTPSESTPAVLPAISFDLGDLASLQDTIANLTIPELPTLEPIPTALPAPEAVAATVTTTPITATSVAPKAAPRPTAKPATKPTSDATIRVPVEQLQQINTLFGTLILDRNGINLRLGQFQELMPLLRQRMNDLEGFNLDLRRWYDKSSMEDLVSSNGGAVRSDANTNSNSSNDNGFDALEMDQYSELHLLAQAQMETIVKLQEVINDINLTYQEVQQANNNLNLTSRNLQTKITRTQMRPFEEIVGRFPRVMRDYAVKYGKQVNLTIEGEQTLFERSTLDILTDPLNHLLRNAFDHGIESPEARQLAGKPAEGNIKIRASQRGNRAIVTMSDDGGGINLEKIRAKVRNYGIPEAQIQAFSEQKLLDMIFDAGFSTADKVTELSGRGVGMDVVKSNLQKVQGDIAVSTELGKGTTFTISIPLSLSIFRVMLLESNGFSFALPLDMVKEILPLTAIERSAEHPDHILWQGESVLLFNPDSAWQFAPGTKLNELSGNPMINHPLVVIVGSGDQRYALPIRRYWSEQEVAIRPVNSPFPLPTGFSGVTTLGDGRIVPLLDPIVLMNEQLSQLAIAIQEDNAGTNPASPSTDDRNQIPTILVVDDSIHARRYLALSLEKAGYQVEQARDGREAVDQLLSGLQVQAVICDVEMPRLDGYGVLSEIKTRPEFRNLPIAMLTSRSNEKHRKLAMNLGATAYFSKPYNEQELLQTLEALV
jgi:two-component system, chemotaxis family, sensor histidine kinase and response regulator PixL